LENSPPAEYFQPEIPIPVAPAARQIKAPIKPPKIAALLAL
jgi:hypothetical protein